MVPTHTVLKFMVGHALAGATVILGALLVTFACFVVSLITATDGIDNPVAVIPALLSMMGTVGMFAVAASTCAFLISVFLQRLRSRWRFPVLLPILFVPLVAFLTVVPIYWNMGGVAFATVVSWVTFVFFGCYWMILTSSAAVLDFLRRKWTHFKAR